MRIFETLAWAACLEKWPGPGPEERPTAYVVILLDTNISRSADIDVGVAAQTILLAAPERGLGGCMFGAVRREELAARLALPPHLDIALVIALGKPVERDTRGPAGRTGPSGMTGTRRGRITSPSGSTRS